MPQERSAAEIYGRDFPVGAVVFEEGDPGSRMHVIISGAVRIEKRVGERRLTLAVFRDGELFGEMARFEDAPRSATAVVERAGLILEIGEDASEALVLHKGKLALRHTEPRVRYEAPAAREAAELGGLPGGSDRTAELLRARLRRGGDERAGAELRDRANHLHLARRFDPEERARSTP
jgi:CRP-like cAMP-binding protein